MSDIQQQAVDWDEQELKSADTYKGKADKENVRKENGIQIAAKFKNQLPDSRKNTKGVVTCLNT